MAMPIFSDRARESGNERGGSREVRGSIPPGGRSDQDSWSLGHYLIVAANRRCSALPTNTRSGTGSGLYLCGFAGPLRKDTRLHHTTCPPRLQAHARCGRPLAVPAPPDVNYAIGRIVAAENPGVPLLWVPVAGAPRAGSAMGRHATGQSHVRKRRMDGRRAHE